MIVFDQRPFVSGRAIDASLANEGYAFVPASCRGGGCKVHVAFHGCLQNQGGLAGRGAAVFGEMAIDVFHHHHGAVHHHADADGQPRAEDEQRRARQAVPDTLPTERVLGQLKFTVRRNYSSPPIHGGQIVAHVLADADLRPMWEAELAAMRDRIQAMRQTLHRVISAKVPGRDFSYFLTQRGMFSYTGLSAAQVDRLREEFAVYLVRSGRICVAGLNHHNVEYAAQAMATVMAG